MKTKNKIIIATLLLCGSLMAGVAGVNEVAASAQEAESFFKVQSASLRIPDETYGEGIRFTIVMDADTYKNENVANLTTGILLIPTYALGESETLEIGLNDEAMINVSEGAIWTEKDGVMTLYVHLYNIPDTEYTTDISIRAYVDDNDDATIPLYTDVATTSVAKTADWLYDNDSSLDTAEKDDLKASYLTYDVFFHNGDVVEKSAGVYGEKISAPAVADKAGYTFVGWWNKTQTAEWDFDNTTVSGTTTNLYAKWTANTDTVYVVKHYQQNLFDDGYTEVMTDVENKTGTTETATAAVAKTYEGFTAKAFEQATIAADGSTVVSIYYDRNTYTVSFNTDGGSTVPAQTVRYGTPASALANFSSTKDGYIFVGWTFEDSSEIPADAKVTGNITVKAKWSKGSIYGTGITVTATSETGVVEEKAFEEGENAGYTRTYVSYSGGNYGTIAVRADASAGLKVNTSYKVLLTVEVDGNFPAFYDHDADLFIIGQPGGVITVDVMTNENGELEWVDRVYYNEGSYVDFVGVAIVENRGSAYGTGVTVTGTGSAVTAESKLYTEGEKAGYTRTYFTYSYCDPGTFTVAADASAGLKANTTYEVTVTYEMDAEFPAIFNADVTFSLSKSEGVWKFEITTDANGAFNQTWSGIVWNAGTYLDVVGVSIEKKPESIYGTGITVTATSETGVVEVKAFEDGENAGYTRTYVTFSGGNNGTIAVRADASAGLKANTLYKVLLTVAVDGNFPAFFDHDANSFIIGQPGGVITVDVMTNENGELEWVDRVYYNGGSYVDFVSVAIVEDHGSVYGAGVTVTGTGSAVGAETKFYTEGEKAGYTRTYFTYSYCDPGTFTVAADASAGLKANTTYEVTVTYEMDAEFPAIFNADVTFSLSKSEGVWKFEITTDANGTFNQTWSGIVWNAGTYLDVVGVSFTEK